MSEEESNLVRLEVGGDHRHVRIARLVATGVASLAGFDVESVEDLRIAVDEGCVWLIENGRGGPIRLEFRVLDDQRVEVVGESDAGGGDAAPSILVQQILAASCTEHELAAEGPLLRFRLVTRAGVREETSATPGGTTG